jgi:hypothetical protein
MLNIARFAAAGLVLCGGAVWAVEPAASPAPVAADEVQQLRDDLAAMRLQLAQARLELQSARRELDDIRQFLAAKDAPGDLERWSNQRQALEEERKQLTLERKKLDAARQSLRDITRGQVAKNDKYPAAPAPAAAATDDPKWDVDYKVALIPLNGGDAVFVNPIGGDLLLEGVPQVDHRHIKLRGTFQNRSTAPWRYTFEARLADQRGVIIGRWRYQTPVLTANELHAFEATIPVTEVSFIRTYQIGNIEADRPGPKDAVPAAPRPAGPAPAPGNSKPGQP